MNVPLSTVQRIAVARAHPRDGRRAMMFLMRHMEVIEELVWCGPTAWLARDESERLAHYVDGLREKVGELGEEMRRFERDERRASKGPPP